MHKMISLYRLARSEFAEDLSGEGARLFGGRWNHPGTRCLYAASSRSLALLEFTVHLQSTILPKALSLVTLLIPEEDIYEVPMKQLPKNWQRTPAPGATKNFGTSLLHTGNYSVIQLPSVIIEQEYIYLLNPEHAHARRWKISDIQTFQIDPRLF